MHEESNNPAYKIRNAVLTALGLVMMLSLPGMWVAWTPNMLLGIVGTSVAAGVFYCLLSRDEPPGKAGDPEFQRKFDDLKVRHFPDEKKS